MSIFRKIGRILLLVGGILELLSMALLFLLAIAGFVVGLGFASTIMPDNEVLMLGLGIGGGVLFLIWAVICLIAGVFGIKGFKAHEKGNYIGCIVLGVLSGFEILLLAGAVLGLIALKKEKKEAEQQPEEAKAE